MNKYVVAYCNLMEGTLIQKVVFASSSVEAGKLVLGWEGGAYTNVTTLDSLYEVVFNCDGFLSVLKLNE